MFKPPKNFSALMICLSFFVSAHEIKAQIAKDPGVYPVDTRGNIVRSARPRLLTALDNASSHQEKEKTAIQKLAAKKDSLQLLANIDAALAESVSARLTEKQKQLESLDLLINSAKERFHPFSRYKKQYVALYKDVMQITGSVKSYTIPLSDSLRKIEEELNASDLSGEKKQMKTVLNTAGAQQEKEAAKLGEIDGKKDSMLSSGGIDKATSDELDARLRAYKHRMDSLNREIKELKEKIDSPDAFRKDRAIIKARVYLIDSAVNKSAGTREYVYNMIDEGLKKSTRTMFSLAAFFGSGGYVIPAEKYPAARKYFSPIIDSLKKFSNQYSSLLRVANITVKGYADASRIMQGSKLYKTISDYTGNENLVKEELNAGLSAMRAGEISKFLTMVIKEKSPEFTDLEKVLFENVEAGMGEELPDPKILNYKIKDERRRIVVIYWSVLPAQ